MKSSHSGFSLKELVLAIFILAVLLVLLLPWLNQMFFAKSKSHPLNYARQFQLATMTMSLDSFSKGTGPSWAFNEETRQAPSLAEFGSNLVAGNYMQAKEIPELLSAPGIKGAYPISRDHSAFNFYPVSESDSANTIFIVTRNWTPYQPLNSNSVPYGDKGFIVMCKGGGGRICESREATNSTATGVLTTNAGGLPLK